MEKSPKRENLTQLEIRKGKGKVNTARETRGSSKNFSKIQGPRGRGIVEEESGVVRRRKPANQKSGSARVKKNGKNNGKTVLHAVVDAIFGNFKSCVANVNELHMKKDEDTQKCSRSTRTIENSSKRRLLLTISQLTLVTFDYKMMTTLRMLVNLELQKTVAELIKC